MTKGKVVLLVLGTIIIIIGCIIGGICLSEEQTLYNVPPVDTDTNRPAPQKPSIIQYKHGKCLVINKIDCPPDWCPPFACAPGCQDDLNKCQENYKTIQKFCDVNCQENLDECLQMLTETRNHYWYSVRWYL